MFPLLERFMIRETDVKDICVELAERGTIENTWGGDSRKPRDGTSLVWGVSLRYDLGNSHPPWAAAFLIGAGANQGFTLALEAASVRNARPFGAHPRSLLSSPVAWRHRGPAGRE